MSADIRLHVIIIIIINITLQTRRRPGSAETMCFRLVRDHTMTLVSIQ